MRSASAVATKLVAVAAFRVAAAQARLAATIAFRVAAAVAAIGAVGMAAPAANAGQIVYPAGGGIWVMNEDGTGQRELVQASQVPDMMALYDPDVQPNGTEVAFVGEWSNAISEEARSPMTPGACGGNCYGYYELNNGVAKRVSPAPFPCPSPGCISEETDPRVASDGSVAYVYQEYLTDVYCEFTCYYYLAKTQSALLSRDPGGGSQQQWKTPCEEEALEGSGTWATEADILAISPADPTKIAYANCSERMEGMTGLTYPTAFYVLLSGANRANGEEYSTAATNPVTESNGEFDTGACCEIGDVSYSPDGKELVDVRSNVAGTAGIYTYPNANNGSAPGTELLAIPEGWSFYSARYIGGGKIAFTAGTDTDEDGIVDHIDIYAISASCAAATCSFPASAENLTKSGNVTLDYIQASANFGYTSSNVEIPAVPSSGGSGGGSGGGAGGGSGGGSGGSGGESGGNGPSGAGAPVIRALKISPKAFSLKGRQGKRSGAVISYRDSAPANVELTVFAQIEGVRKGKRCVAVSRRQLHRAPRKKRCKSWHEAGHISHRDRAGRNKISFSGKLGRHKLRPGRYLLKAVASDSGGHSKALSAKFVVKR